MHEGKCSLVCITPNGYMFSGLILPCKSHFLITLQNLEAIGLCSYNGTVVYRELAELQIIMSQSYVDCGKSLQGS